MAEQVLKTIFQLKRGQSAAWASANPVLRVGEPGFEIDTGKLKIGNGVDAYNDLPYLTDNEIKQIQSLEASIVEMQGLIGSESEGTGLYGLINEKANVEEVYTKDEVNNIVSGVYSYKGTVANFADLPTDALVGDVYNIENGDLEHGIVPGDNVVWNGNAWDKLAGTVDLSAYLTKEQFKEDSLYFLTKEEAQKTISEIKYEFTNVPKGTLVDYREKEIRVMCPEGTVFTKQNVGAGGNADRHYATFKAYAPEGAVSFKEDTAEIISDQTMYYFENNSSAGVDAFGRKYSVVWLALASYDATTDTWTYFGKKSSKEKMIGWTYTVEWYDADGVMIGNDQIRINLANESCYLGTEPYAMRNVVKQVALNGTLLDVINNRVDINFTNEDGELTIGKVNVNDLVQTDGDVLIFDGGAIE